MNWRCPYCNHNAIIGNEGKKSTVLYFQPNKTIGRHALVVSTIFCPNDKCNQFTASVTLQEAGQNQTGWFLLNEIQTWQLLPESSARPFPEYIPAQLLADYKEACLIQTLSPKASATLSRRCLQGMIRDFWNIRKSRLIDEINALEEKLDTATWEAIDALRKVGNIGAHMEKDIDLIVDVEPDEAGLLIGLIESLFEDWYVARHERQQKMTAIKALAAQKEQERAASNQAPPAT